LQANTIARSSFSICA